MEPSGPLETGTLSRPEKRLSSSFWADPAQDEGEITCTLKPGTTSTHAGEPRAEGHVALREPNSDSGKVLPLQGFLFQPSTISHREMHDERCWLAGRVVDEFAVRSTRWDPVDVLRWNRCDGNAESRVNPARERQPLYTECPRGTARALAKTRGRTRASDADREADRGGGGATGVPGCK